MLCKYCKSKMELTGKDIIGEIYHICNECYAEVKYNTYSSKETWFEGMSEEERIEGEQRFKDTE